MMEEDIIATYIQHVYKEVIERDDIATKKCIYEYIQNRYPKEDVRVDFLDKEIVDEIIDLGIQEYLKAHRGDKR